MEETYKLAERLASMPPLSVRAVKRITYASLNKDLDTALELSAANLPVVRMSDDRKEAVAAYKEKRKPSFKGS